MVNLKKIREEIKEIVRRYFIQTDDVDKLNNEIERVIFDVFEKYLLKENQKECKDIEYPDMRKILQRAIYEMELWNHENDQ